MTRTEALIHLTAAAMQDQTAPERIDPLGVAHVAVTQLNSLQNEARAKGYPLRFDPEPRDVEPGDLGHDGEPLDGPPAHWIQVTNHAHELVIDEPIDQLDGRGDFPIPAGAFLRVFRSGEDE